MVNQNTSYSQHGLLQPAKCPHSFDLCSEPSSVSGPFIFAQSFTGEDNNRYCQWLCKQLFSQSQTVSGYPFRQTPIGSLRLSRSQRATSMETSMPRSSVSRIPDGRKLCCISSSVRMQDRFTSLARLEKNRLALNIWRLYIPKMKQKSYLLLCALLKMISLGVAAKFGLKAL